MHSFIARLTLIAAAICNPLLGPVHAAPPAGFTLESWPGDWREVCGVVPVGDGRFVAWERGGIAWMVGPDGIASVEPMLDLGEEVGAWRDHGLLGLALDPDFASNGFVYLLYTVDRHHLLYAGTREYDPEANWYNAATIGRITRYTATLESDRAVVDPSSRTILLGESIDTGLPVLHQSHAVGSLAFGTDGTLLCSMGDSATYNEVDTGGQVGGGWVTMGLEDGIIEPSQDIGAYRAQYVHSLCGKILRIDPATGDGVPSNPWFDASAPRGPASRVWAMGLRNGFRMTLTPGSGSTDPAAGDPGQITYGDVGWSSREEIGIVDGPGINLGWPLFEGLDPNSGYWSTNTEHPLATNPLQGEGCPSRFRFRDLLVEDGETATNPCDPAWLEPDDWSGPSFETIWAGYTGDGYLDFGSGVGEWIDFEFETTDAGPHEYTVRYANGGPSARPVEVMLDGEFLTILAMRSTGGWTRWSKANMTIATEPGLHVLRLRTTIANGPNVDRIDTPDRPHTPIPNDMWSSHHRPTIDWKHGVSEARVPVFDSTGAADLILIGDEDCPVSGNPFGGNSVTGGPMINDDRWPTDWRGLFMADYIFGWIRVLQIDSDGVPSEVRSFDNTAGPITAIAHDPASGTAVMVRWNQNPVQIIPPESPCPADLDGDGQVGGSDIGLLLAGWSRPGITDLDGDGTTGGSDLGLLLASWGACSP